MGGSARSTAIVRLQGWRVIRRSLVEGRAGAGGRCRALLRIGCTLRATHRGRAKDEEVSITQQIGERRHDVLRVARGHGATRVRVFGSVAKGEAGPDSDLDLLVDFEPGDSLLALIAIKQDIEDLLGREVDVVTEAAVSPHLRERIVREATVL